MEYSQVSTGDLEKRFDHLYLQINAELDSLPAGTWTEPYRAAKRQLMTLETEFHAIGTELSHRFAFQRAAQASSRALEGMSDDDVITCLQQGRADA